LSYGELEQEIRELASEAQRIRRQIEELKGKFYAELEALRRKYLELLHLIAEKVAKLAELMGTRVEHVVEELRERGVIHEDECAEVVKLAKLFLPPKKAAGAGKAAREQPAPATVKERLDQMVRQSVRSDLRDLMEAGNARRPFPYVPPPTSARPATFTCPFCNEEHEVPERHLIEICDMCLTHLNFLVSQGVFKEHGAVFRRLISELSQKIEKALVKVDNLAKGRRG
jgi:polyhydroxyalkanoate synthesis regulator phasin